MSHDDIGIILEHVDSRFDLMLEMIQVLATDMHEVKRQVAHMPAIEAQLDSLTPLVKDHELRLRLLEMPGRA